MIDYRQLKGPETNGRFSVNAAVAAGKKSHCCRHVLIEEAEVLLLADIGGESDDCLIISR